MKNNKEFLYKPSRCPISSKKILRYIHAHLDEGDLKVETMSKFLHIDLAELKAVMIGLEDMGFWKVIEIPSMTQRKLDFGKYLQKKEGDKPYITNNIKKYEDQLNKVIEQPKIKIRPVKEAFHISVSAGEEVCNEMDHIILKLLEVKDALHHAKSTP
jgi:hypothetical protein